MKREEARAPAQAVWRAACAVPQACADAVAAALESAADATAVLEPDPRGLVRIEAYFSRPPDEGWLRALVALAASSLGLPEPRFDLAELPAADGVGESLRALPPIRVGRFFVHGSHFKGRPPAGSVPLLLDAATAFGTGRHESTRGCLEALERLARRRRFARALDLGCGSGILALAMARLWRASVAACDNDPEAVRVARANAARNGLASHVRVGPSEGLRAPWLKAHAPFDLVAANLQPRPLRTLARDLAAMLAPGGAAVLSGLLAGEARAVEARYRAAGLRLAFRLDRGGWRTLAFCRGRTLRDGRRARASGSRRPTS